MGRHRAPSALLAAVSVAVVSAASLLGACRSDTVAIEYRPRAGAEHRYRITVEADTVTTIEGRQPRKTSSSFVLRASHRVVAANDFGATVAVSLRAEGEDSQQLLVRLDRAGQLAEVESVEGVASSRLGQVGLAEIFPASAGAPPAQRLSPGERWTVDEPVRLPGARLARLRGTGRLASLGVVRGRHVATVDSELRLPVRGFSSGAAQGGTALLEGTQSTSSRTTYALDDGVVESSTSTTRSRLTIELDPPPGTDASALGGTVVVDVRSHATRER